MKKKMKKEMKQYADNQKYISFFNFFIRKRKRKDIMA
jgi:hypothetical protein